MMPPATPSRSALPSTTELDGPAAALDCADDSTVPEEPCELCPVAAELPDDWFDEALEPFELPVDAFELAVEPWLPLLDAFEALLEFAELAEVRPVLAEVLAEFADDAPD